MGGQLAVISEFNQLAKSAAIFCINMSYCKSSGEDGKDKVIFLTEDDAAKPSKVELSNDESADTPRGLITESGEINWECPCLGGMPSGPCGVEFREAFSCFHYRYYLYFMYILRTGIKALYLTSKNYLNLPV